MLRHVGSRVKKNIRTILFLFPAKIEKATPRKGTVLVNVGDLLEIYSNGLFPATLHRVVIPGLFNF